MTTVDQTWEWISAPLGQLKSDHLADPETPWEELRRSFLDRLGLQEASQSPAVQQLLEQLDDYGDNERNAIVGSDQLDTLAYGLVQQNAVSDDDQAGEAAYDEQAWLAFVAENGAQWDGTDESWDQFTEWFAFHADEQGLGLPSNQLLEYLASQTVPGRIGTLAQYGVTITPPGAAEWAGAAESAGAVAAEPAGVAEWAAEPEPAGAAEWAAEPEPAGAAEGEASGEGYDEQAWGAFLAENDARWDGTEENWDQFRESFADDADQRGLGVPANGLLNYLIAQPVAERIAILASYGVTISPAPDGAGQGEASAEAQDAEAAPEAETEMTPEEIDTVVSDLLAEHPEFGDIPEADRARIVAEVLGEFETS